MNTASAIALATLAKQLNPLNVSALVASQQGGGFASMDVFLAHDSLAGLEINAGAANINSEYFAVYVESTFADRTTRLQSILRRNLASGEIKLISRDRSSHFLWPKPDDS